MQTSKVHKYRYTKQMSSSDMSIAILVEMLKEFEVIPEMNIVFYGKLCNLQYDLKRIKQNRIQNNKNRPILTEG